MNKLRKWRIKSMNMSTKWKCLKEWREKTAREEIISSTSNSNAEREEDSEVGSSGKVPKSRSTDNKDIKRI